MSVLERIITHKHRRRNSRITPKPAVKQKPTVEVPPAVKIITSEVAQDYTEIVFTLKKHLHDLSEEFVADAPPVLEPQEEEQQPTSPRADNIARLIRKKSQIENRVK